MLELKRLKAELARVSAAKFEQDYQIHLKKAEIERLQDNFNKQEVAEAALLEKINELEKKGNE